MAYYFILLKKKSKVVMKRKWEEHDKFHTTQHRNDRWSGDSQLPHNNRKNI